MTTYNKTLKLRHQEKKSSLLSVLDLLHWPYKLASQVVLVVRNLPANAGDVKRCRFIPWVRKIPGGGHSNSLQYSCLENPHGQRSLLGYSPWSHKESDTVERLSTAQHSRVDKVNLIFI